MCKQKHPENQDHAISLCSVGITGIIVKVDKRGDARLGGGGHLARKTV
jgi:hypothetical protein